MASRWGATCIRSFTVSPRDLATRCVPILHVISRDIAHTKVAAKAMIYTSETPKSSARLQVGTKNLFIVYQ